MKDSEDPIIAARIRMEANIARQGKFDEPFKSNSTSETETIESLEKFAEKVGQMAEEMREGVEEFIHACQVFREKLEQIPDKDLQIQAVVLELYKYADEDTLDEIEEVLSLQGLDRSKVRAIWENIEQEIIELAELSNENSNVIGFQEWQDKNLVRHFRIQQDSNAKHFGRAVEILLQELPIEEEVKLLEKLDEKGKIILFPNKNKE